MAAQEKRHLDAFDKLIGERRVRPTALYPLWHVAGYALGAATALLGREAAMACTVAVEEVIDEHYQKQAAALGADDPELKSMIETFRAEEIEHRDIGLAEGAERAPAYDLLKGAIKAGSRMAIWLAERI
jgi:ubiquinone biosynthesis monooxygenase Coq7